MAEVGTAIMAEVITVVTAITAVMVTAVAGIGVDMAGMVADAGQGLASGLATVALTLPMLTVTAIPLTGMLPHQSSTLSLRLMFITRSPRSR